VPSGAGPGGGPGAPIRLVLVDDHRMFRSGVRAELDEAAGGAIEIVGEADEAARAAAVIAATRPQVVLLDVHLPGGGGIEVLNDVVRDWGRDVSAWRVVCWGYRSAVRSETSAATAW
jgi:DNA-binding NarL/FixJ family response regulator